MPTTLVNLEAQLTNAIAQQETAGGQTGVGATLNNPGGLNYAQWESAYGATQTPGSPFATFPNLQSGMNAITDWVNQHIQKGDTLTSMMNTYAPPSQNPTTPLRIQQLTTLTGLDPNVPISQQVTDPNAAPASPSASGSTVTPTAPATTPAQGILNALLAPLGIKPGTVVVPGQADTSGQTSVWARAATGIIGVIVLIAGLMMLRQTQMIIQPVIDKAKDAAKGVAVAA